MQIFAIVVSLAIAAVGITLFVRAIREILGVIRIGQPAGRTDRPAARTVTMLKETLGHTRMLQWTLVGAAHWFVFVGFGLLFFTLLTAFGQLFDAHFAIPLIGHFFLYEWATEFFTVVMVLAILGFIAYRLSRPRERTRGAKGRFFGSTMWQGYFVELVILGVGLCIVALRGLEYALFSKTAGEADLASAFHFPFTSWLGEAFSGLSVGTIETLIYLIAMLKIVISFAWMITISLNTTMGVAWHRFSAFFNIWFRREADGRNALGEMKPLTSNGQAISLDDIEELDEDATLGVGAIEDFSWKGILDFTTCTECGRCQSQCPAWNTEKPLSPKLLVMGLRDHAYAKAPYLHADSEESRAELSATALKEAERPLVGDTGDDWFYMPENGSAVIDPDVLWSCTSCGACVQQCPVDIEHVDHIMDMRRYQVLVEANFPAELNQLFKGLENKGNPWNMSASARMDWAKDLPFDVKVVGEDIESLDDVDWLFWVGCAGAYEDRAKKTTRAVAELLDMAGVSFGVLGNGETCNGDPARRAGNEFVFQGLATQNAETFKEFKVKKVVSTCAHCFNTLKNEYKDFGVELEVVHHTQLLNRLVREGKLTPVTEGAGATKRSITYHDPCFIGRHNGVYTPPRELLQIMPGAEVVEMERNSERSFCCGAGGARMWMEENIGERINVNRTKEAVGTGADQIAVGCPFCRVMLSDGLTAEQANGNAREEVEVLDVAQMLLASVKGEQATKAAPGSSAKAAKANGSKPTEAKAGTATGAAAGAAAGTATADAATKAEPAADDVTQTDETVTDTEDVGPAAKASGGSSLFDTPAESETATEEKSVPEEATAAKPESSGGSLFDLGGEDEASSSQPADEAKAAQPAEDEADDEAAAAPAQSEPAQTDSKPAAEGEDLGAGGSLFDIGRDTDEAGDKPPAADKADAAESAPETSEDAPAADSQDQAEPEPETAREPEAAPAEPAAAESQHEAADESAGDESFSGGSLFDIKAKHEAKAAGTTEAAQPTDTAEQAAEDTSSDEPAADPSEASAEHASSEEPVPAEAEPESAEDDAATTSSGEPEKSATPAASGAASAPASEIPEDGSLFDIEAPAEAAPPAQASTPEPAESTEPTGEDRPTESADAPAEDDAAEAADTAADDEQAEESPDAAAEEDPSAEAAAAEPADSAADEQPTHDSDEQDSESAAEKESAAESSEPESSTDEPAKERPAPSGEAHTPKTDVEINESGSLFDL